MRLRIALIAAVLVTGILVVVAYPVIIGGGPVFDNPGGAAGKLLRGGVYPGLTIEIDTEVELPQGKLDRIADFVGRYTDKLVIVITQTLIDVNPDSGSAFTLDGIQTLNSEHRNTAPFFFLSMSIHIFIISGFFERDDVIGIAYGPTSIAVFLGLGLTSTLSHIDAIISHEIGHLMGLNCASGLEPPAGSEWFCDGTGHSTVAPSLMAPSLAVGSSWVIALELLPVEVEQLEFIKANQ